jgi:4-hydroxythreonine-4-phosphate dehydrogenase
LSSLPRLIITPGEPAGIGPDVTIQIAQKAWAAELIVVADPVLLQKRAAELHLPLTLDDADLSKPASIHRPGHLKIIPVTLKAAVESGKLNVANAAYVLQCLEVAADICLQKKADALVTGPVQKNIINEAGIPFTGHTEFLAARTRAQSSLMLFVVDDLKVALATMHLPLAKVPQALTKEKLESSLRLLDAELKNKFQIHHPHIFVCGLNPHAGEQGNLGREEIDIIEPVLKKLRAENFNLTGPLPADTIFTKKVLKNADAILAMYHDQALPVVKYLGFDRAVNVTLGLPIIRTSVDHGTALDIAGSGKADAGSLTAALKLAIQIFIN